mmetsp:Transcript_89715/g.254361  ORF Transcript_89715/g.254361 Transcript_89715/m.254361 type:complete len:308 (+) Transcript_89715:103-1026(+)
MLQAGAAGRKGSGSASATTEIDEGEPFLCVDDVMAPVRGPAICSRLRVRTLPTGCALLLGASLLVAVSFGRWGDGLPGAADRPNVTPSASPAITAAAPSTTGSPAHSDSRPAVFLPAAAEPAKAVSLQGAISPVSCAAYGCIEYNPRHACQCNTRCSQYHNCCSDYAGHCLIPETAEAGPGPHSCRVYGCKRYNKTQPCQCNRHCAHYHNCCSDFCHTCKRAWISSTEEELETAVSELAHDEGQLLEAGSASSAVEQPAEEEEESGRSRGGRAADEAPEDEESSAEVEEAAGAVTGVLESMEREGAS